MARSRVIAWPSAQAAANAPSLKAARMVARLRSYSTRSAGHQAPPEARSRASAAPSSRAAHCDRPRFAAKPANPARHWPLPSGSGHDINKKASKPQIGRLFCRLGEMLYSLTVKTGSWQAYT